MTITQERPTTTVERYIDQYQDTYWRQHAPELSTVSATAPGATTYGTSGVMLNAAAMALVGADRWALVYTSPIGQIALRPLPHEPELGFTISTGNRHKGGYLRMKTLLATLGIGRGTRFTAERQGDLIVLTPRP